MILWISDIVDYFEKLISWHWELVTESPRMTRTAFAILVMLKIHTSSSLDITILCCLKLLLLTLKLIVSTLQPFQNMKEQKGKSWENLLRWKSWGKIGEYLIEMQSLVVWKPLCWMYYLFKLPKFWVITSPIRGDQGKVVLGPQTTVTKLICWGAKFEYYWKASF